MSQTISENLRLGSLPGKLAQLANRAAQLDQASPEETLRWAFDEFGGDVTIATGFGMEGVALIDMAVRINPRLDVFFLDTAFLFRETYDLRRRLEDRYQIQIRAYETEITSEQQERRFGAKLWSTDPDLCCRLRKLEPLKAALAGRRAWITAIRRDQTLERSNARAVEWDYQWQLVKINPLVRWGAQDARAYIDRNDVPYNPLHDQGYPSIGCTHCTRPIREGEPERSGRWSGLDKRECGIHARVKPASSVTDGTAHTSPIIRLTSSTTDETRRA